jgi:type IX secretion system substrate protein
MRMLKKSMLQLCVVLFWLVLGVGLGQANTYIVDSPADDGGNTNTTLREAITFGANMNPGPDTVVFAVGVSITVYDVLNINGQVLIQGAGQTLGANSKTFPLLNFGAGSDGSTLSAMALVDSDTAILLDNNANRQIIQGCRIGTDWADVATRGNNIGILLEGDYNLIGGDTAAKRNVISNNAVYGIHVYHISSNPQRNKIQGNYIGLVSDGTSALANNVGVYMSKSFANLVGGSAAGNQGNIISGNTLYGVHLDSVNCLGNTISGNIIGLNATQANAIANGVDGIRVTTFAAGNFIGLPQAGFHNVIAGNVQTNIRIGNGSTNWPSNNWIQGNFIGVNDSENNPTWNDDGGIYLQSSNNNVIGGDRNTGERNIISGHTTGSLQGGIILNDSQSNSVMGNYIGTDDGGLAARPNLTGIEISGTSQSNVVGGPNRGGILLGNVVSGNSSHGIALTGGTLNKLIGNVVGLNGAGDAALPNTNYGIDLQGTNQTVGSGTLDERNTVAGNGLYEINVNSTYSRISGNYFSLNQNGTAAIVNGSGSLRCYQNFNTFIGNVAADRFLFLGGSQGNSLVANRIGLLPNGNPTGSTLDVGIRFEGGAGGTEVGTRMSGQGNLITNVTGNGIEIDGASSVGVAVFGNTITACTGEGISHLNNGNNNYAAPSISVAVAGQKVIGTANPGDFIEVFAAESSVGNGGSTRYFTSTTADGAGNWTVIWSGLGLGSSVCALATDGSGNTSEFSANVSAIMPTHTVTITPTLTMTPTATLTITATVTPTSDNPLIPFDLKGETSLAYPNPADEEMRFLFHFDHTTQVDIAIYNFNGEKITNLRHEFQPGGGQILIWDCSGVAPGIYILRLFFDGEEKQRKKIAIVH